MYLAIDIGATKTLITLFSPRGRRLKICKFPTAAREAAFLAELGSRLAPFTGRPITHIVLAVPGVVQKICSTTTPVSGPFTPQIDFGNLSWQNPDFGALLGRLFPGARLYILNDADLATLYEASFYRSSLCYLTFSTGIGGGLAQNGRLLPESATFEPGHARYTFAGQSQEWEDFAAMSAIRQAHGGKFARAIRGQSAFRDIAARLTPGLANIITEYSPQTIVLGGPLALIFRRFISPLRESLAAALPGQALPQLVPAKKPTESVIYGCYLYAKTQDSH